MKESQSIHCWLEYHNLYKKTFKTLQFFLSKFSTQFGERDENSLTSDEVLYFLTQTNQRTLLQPRCAKQEIFQ